MRSCRRFAFAPVLSVLAAVLVATGCSNPREDVRVTLCKDIVTVQLGPSVNLQGADTQTKGYEYAAVRVRYAAQSGEGQAVCYFNYNEVEDTALTLSDPLSAYATSPFEVTIGGQKLSRPGLAEAVKQAMLKQGREFVDRAKKGIEDAVQR